MRFSVRERERRSPRSSEDHPAIDLELPAKFFDIVDQIPCRILVKRSMGFAFSRSALIEKNDPVMFWIEKSSVAGLGAATGTPMNEDHGLTFRIAAFFIIERVEG